MNRENFLCSSKLDDTHFDRKSNNSFQLFTPFIFNYELDWYKSFKSILINYSYIVEVIVIDEMNHFSIRKS